MLFYLSAYFLGFAAVLGVSLGSVWLAVDPGNLYGIILLAGSLACLVTVIGIAISLFRSP